MANTLDRAKQTRKYAEDLIGPNNRSYFDTQRNVAKDIYQTNFDTIKNNFQNLKERLEAQRVKSNLAFNEGLGDVADTSYNRVSNQSADLVSRGLTSSGVGNRVTQADTTAKGEAVQRLLSTLGGDVNAQMEALKQGGEKVAASERELNTGLSDTLGDIGVADVSNQINYNKGAAGIAGSKDARDDANELAALQRAANAAANSSKKSKEDEELEQYYKNKIIANILTGYDQDTGEAIEYDDRQKENALKILFDLDGGSAVEGYNKNIKATDTYNEKVKEFESKIKKQGSDNGKLNAQDRSNIYDSASNEQKFLDTLLRNGEDKIFDRTGDGKKLVDYLNQQFNLQGKNASGSISEREALQLLNKVLSGNFEYAGLNNTFGYAPGGSFNNSGLSLQDLVNTYNQYKSGETPLLGQQFSNTINNRPGVVNANNQLSDYKKQGITYEDLAKILYGSK